MTPPFPNSPRPSYYRNAVWNTVSSKRNGVHYVGDTVTITLNASLVDNVTYTVRNYYGTVVSTGSVSSGTTSFTPTVPSGGWDPGWYRIYLTGPQSTANFADAYGATNFCVVRDDNHFVPMPAGDTVGGTGVTVDMVMKGVMGAGTSRMSIADAANPTNDPGNGNNLAGCTADLARTMTYWVNPGAPYADASRPRYAWIDFPGGGVDTLTAGVAGVYFMCANETLDGSQVFVEIVAGTTGGTLKTNVYYPDASTLVETFDNLPPANKASWSTAINGVSNYIVFFWQEDFTPALRAKAAIGNSYFAGVSSVVATLYPLGCTHYEGPANEPNTSTQSRGFIAHQMRLFAGAVHDGHADAQAMGPAFVGLFWTDTRGWYGFFNAGGHNYCDALSFHAYNAQTNGDINLGRATFDAFQALMEQFNVDLPLWQTESTHAFSSVYGVYHPRRARVYMLETLVQEQYGIPKEQNNSWYDISHGFWAYPAWMENGDGSLNPQAVLYRVLSEETWGKPFASALDFGTPGNNIFLGNVYTGDAGTTVALMATSFITNASVTLSITGGSGTATIIDGFGNETSDTIPGRVTVPLTDIPSYVRFPVGTSVTVFTVNDWDSPDLGISKGPLATSREIDGVSYPLIADDAYMTYYDTMGIAPVTWSTPPSNSEIMWAGPQTFSRVLIWAGPAWQNSGTLADFTIQTTLDGANWVTQETVTKSLDSFSFGTDATNVGCFTETYWDEQWVFDVDLGGSVEALGLRVNVSEASYGGEPLSSSGFGQGNADQAYRIQEIGVFLEEEGGGMAGPCTPWVDGDDVAACCSVESSSGLIFDTVAQEASDILFQLSGRQFPGECEKTVRPCADSCGCNWQVLSRGFVVWPGMYGYWDWGLGSWGWGDSDQWGCRPLSRVKLSGYPVTEITEVKVNGDILPTTDYRLDQARYLTRMDNGWWPACQNLSLEDTESGTWSVTYNYGQSPPEIGQSAAAQLGCELYKACAGQACALPTGVTRTTRQGVTVEKLAFTTWAFLPASRIRGGRAPGWQTGLTLVDAFLNTYNPTGRSKQPVFWAPGKRQYAPRVGT